MSANCFSIDSEAPVGSLKSVAEGRPGAESDTELHDFSKFIYFQCGQQHRRGGSFVELKKHICITLELQAAETTNDVLV